MISSGLIQTIRATKNSYLLYMKDKKLATFNTFSLSKDYFKFLGFNDCNLWAFKEM